MSKADHEAHEMPLAWRLVDGEIREWLSTRVGITKAATGEADETERARQQGIDHLHSSLTDFTHALTPQILGALERAGLIIKERANG